MYLIGGASIVLKLLNECLIFRHFNRIVSLLVTIAQLAVLITRSYNVVKHLLLNALNISALELATRFEFVST